MIDDAPGLHIDVLRGEPTDEELAALTAVVIESYTEEAASAVAATVARSAWSVSQRSLRRPLSREFGWRSFPSG